MSENAYTQEQIAHFVEQMCSTEGFKIVVQYLNVDRERIIEAGKQARKEELQIQNWAKLDGFDMVMKRITVLRNTGNYEVKLEEE